MSRIVAEATGSEFESRGSTTFKQTEMRKAAEPDTCFYVQDADRIIGVARIDLKSDPWLLERMEAREV